MADEKLVYLDTSAFVKVVIAEPETAALVTALTPKALLVASEILEVEALRAPAARQERTASPPRAPSSLEYACCR